MAGVRQAHRNINFLGACFDIGAQRSCIGWRQALSYCRESGIKFKLRPSDYAFMFGDGLHPSLVKL